MLGALRELLSVLPVELGDKAFQLILVLEAVGIAAIIYVIYAVVMGLFTYRRIKKVEHIERKADLINKKLNAIDKKLDKLIKKKR